MSRFCHLPNHRMSPAGLLVLLIGLAACGSPSGGPARASSGAAPEARASQPGAQTASSSGSPVASVAPTTEQGASTKAIQAQEKMGVSYSQLAGHHLQTWLADESG